MRDNEDWGVILRLGNIGDTLRYKAIDTGEVGKQMPLEPSRCGLVQADMEEHVPRSPAFSVETAAVATV